MSLIEFRHQRAGVTMPATVSQLVEAQVKSLLAGGA
jgi:hypothetical protein